MDEPPLRELSPCPEIEGDSADIEHLMKILDDEESTSQETCSNRDTSRTDLGDPEWELADPTPNVHALFVQFNGRFFWGKLGSVQVRWSKRMYSCAGICRYEGRGGFCDVALSEPLLKLRPRKDLVETLLHEMIHAYLFIVERDRDREGHGPNFQKHMNRINREANINITIYHSFHDEVKLYQKHWWRCDGICTTKAPYFGIIRRTSNRAPGPNDFWWQQHQAMCGGKFIKIKEPEKKTKKIETKDKKPKENIQKYLNNNNSTTNNKNNTNSIVGSWSGQGKRLSDQNVTMNGDISQQVRNHWANKDLNLNNKRPSTAETPPTKIMKTENVFKNPKLKSPENFTLKDAETLLKNIYGMNVPLNERKYYEVFSPPKPKTALHNTTNIESATLKTASTHNTTTKTDSVKTLIPKNESTEQGPILADTTNVKTPVSEVVTIVDNEIQSVNCMLCGKKVESSKINEHLDVCLLERKEIDDVFTIQDVVECPLCKITVESHLINEHLDACICIEPNMNDNSNTRTDDIVDITSIKSEKLESDKPTVKTEAMPCPVCNNPVSGSLEEHLSICLMHFDDNMASTSSGQRVVDTISLIDDDDFNDSATFNSTGTMHPCPCCMMMVEKDSMNKHIDDCLNKISS